MPGRWRDGLKGAIYARVSGIDRDSPHTQGTRTRFKILLPLLESAFQIEHIDI